jgi:hypothetical protein
VIDREEFDYWCREYPELDRQEILDVLCQFDEDEINNHKGLLEDVALEQLEQRNKTWSRLTGFFK